MWSVYERHENLGGEVDSSGRFWFFGGGLRFGKDFRIPRFLMEYILNIKGMKADSLYFFFFALLVRWICIMSFSLFLSFFLPYLHFF